MSKLFKYAVSAEPPEQRPAAFPAQCGSCGVDVVLKGWKTGLNKVQLTRTFRIGGMGLHDASRLTGEILDGASVRVHLSQFPTVEAAAAALTRIGIAEIRA